MGWLKKLALATLTLSALALSGCYVHDGYHRGGYYGYRGCRGYDCRRHW